VNLNPTKGSEQRGRRPCAVLQNNIANNSRLQTVCIAPLTTSLKNSPTGIIITANHTNNLTEDSRLELSQIRTIDRSRLIQKIGNIESFYHQEINQNLFDFFDLKDLF
jgi:mRNA interferase MazF